MIEFPIINVIDDVLPAVQDREEFVVAVRDGYTIINYNVYFADTFLHPEEEGISSEEKRIRQIRRECRGITFCNDSGKIIRRPYHKFKNVGEAPETQPHLINLSDPHEVLEKLDGSMVSPFIRDGELIWATKMAAPDFHDLVTEFVQERSQYIDFAREYIEGGYTPIFEFIHSQKRIVLKYPEDNMILTGIRHMTTGEYHPLPRWVYDIPIVEAYDGHSDIHEFIEYTRNLQDVEGFVVRFHTGAMTKLKADWYVQIHKAKEAILQDRNIVELILDSKLDDIKPHLLDEERERLNEFESNFNHRLTQLEDEIFNLAVYVTSIHDRKSFALGLAKTLPGPTRSIIFSAWDNLTKETVQGMVHKAIRGSLGRNTKWDELKAIWFPDLDPYNS